MPYSVLYDLSFEYLIQNLELLFYANLLVDLFFGVYGFKIFFLFLCFKPYLHFLAL